MVPVLRKDIRRLMMTKRIMPRVLDAPANYAPTLEVRKGNARYRRGYKNMGGGSVNFRILTLVRRTHALIIGNSQSNQEVHKETSTPRRIVWGFGYHFSSSTHGT